MPKVKSKVKTVRVKTLWQDRAWVADHVLNECLKKGEGLILKYKDETMAVPAAKIDPKYWLKGQEMYRDKFARRDYRLFGIHFVADKKPEQDQMSLF